VIVSREAAKSQKKLASRFIGIVRERKEEFFVIVSREAAKSQKNLRADLLGLRNF
jgi:hypothetical protein